VSNDAIQVDLFGVECNTDVPDANGVRWHVGSIKGWTSPTVRSERAMATGRTGTILLDERHSERVLEVPGTVQAPDQATAWDAYNQLAVMPGLGSSGVVVVHEPTPKSLLVREGEEPRADEPVNGWFEFLLTLVALQPYKTPLTGTTVSISAGATVNVTNDGNVPAYLTVEATTSGTVRVKQMDSLQVLRSKTTVAAGTTFNGTTKRVTSSGGTVLLGVVDNPSEWLSVPRLDTVGIKNEGTALLDVTIYHSYA